MSTFDERLRYLRSDTQDKDALDKIMDLSTALLGGKLVADTEKRQIEREDELFNKRVRLDNVNRLSREFPDIDPNDFGDPITNAEDYQSYLDETKIQKNMITSATNYVPEGGIMSDEMQRDLFTYGASNMRYSLDETATILSYEDIINYDAWLLGAEGEGKDVAKRHNWQGLLVGANADGDYIIDEDDYMDLKEKGIVDYIPEDTFNPGLFVIDESLKTEIIKNYGYWKKAFINSKQPKTKSDISHMITQNNIANQDKLNKLSKDPMFKDRLYNVNRWRIGHEEGFGLVDKNDKYTTDYINDKGVRARDSKTQKRFMKDHPEVFKWLNTNTDFERALAVYLATPALQQELESLPELSAIFNAQWEDFDAIQKQKRYLGITDTQNEWIIDSRIMGDARNMVLDDLQEIGNGILFDEAALSQVDQQTLDGYITQLNELEKAYSEDGSMHYNMDVVRFLSLYGLGGNPTGDTLLNVIDELTKEVPGRY